MSSVTEREKQQIEVRPVPLYQLPEGELPELQVKDLPTAAHFYLMCCGTELGPHTKMPDLRDYYPDYNPFPVRAEDIQLIPGFLYSKQKHYTGIHGGTHGARVGIMGKAVALAERMPPIDANIAYVFGHCHDVARVSDNSSDEGHGRRSASRLSEPDILQRINGYFRRYSGQPLSQQDLEKLRLLCISHEMDYQQIDKRVINDFGYLIEVGMMADILDRCRAPNQIYWPDPQYFPRQSGIGQSIAGKLQEFARWFTFTTEYYRLATASSVEESTMVIAAKMGLVQPENGYGEMLPVVLHPEKYLI